MRVRNITTCALGLAAALTLGSDLAAQQDTTRLRTRSDTRISVSKGEVVPARVDTVYVTRYDTVRVDNTIVRVDTVTVTPPAPVIIPKVKGPMYWGIMGGTTWPYGNIDRLYTNGFHFGGVLGWEQQHGLFGVRADGAMSQLNREQGRNTQLVGTGTPLMLHLAGDVKVKPLNFGGWALYGIAGVNYNRYKRIATVAESGTAFPVGGTVVNGSESAVCGATLDGQGGCYVPANDRQWSDKFGFNFGTGLDFHIGSQDMFLEARWMSIRANGANTWTLPISLGVRYF
jgi:hypothetical protein